METSLNKPQQQFQVEAPGTINDPEHQSPAAPESHVSYEVDPRKNLKPDAQTKIDIQHLNFFYGSKQALTDVSLPIRERQVTALIGPSG